ncbi:MAG: hypothetical protein AB8H80_06055 [Planctomycetota bacterium]
MLKNKLRRRRLVVDWTLQGGLMTQGIVYGLIVLLAMVAGIFAPLLWDVEAGSDGFGAEQSIVLLYLHERFWWIAGLCLLMVVIGALRFSHRIAGPMVRFKRNLRMVSAGDLPTDLRTRPGDFLKAEVECLNTAVRSVGEKVDAIRLAQVAVRRRLSDCISTTFDESQELEQLVAACEELEHAVLQFRHVDTGDASHGEPVRVPEMVQQHAGL